MNSEKVNYFLMLGSVMESKLIFFFNVWLCYVKWAGK